MPSKKQYDLVQNDDYDSRIPLHPDEAFQHGIMFNARYIGILDVPRPNSRVEIVAAMRKIRYEFKTKGVKKKKVTIEISVNGVKVVLRKKKKRKQWLDDGRAVLLSHPIYRIFYVSHDSQDLKIFSYIVREGNSNVFKCAVFKSNKKNQAMKVVRTIGQAFEVCHKLSINAPEGNNDDQETLTQDLISDHISDVMSDKPKQEFILETNDKNSIHLDENSSQDNINSYIDQKNAQVHQSDLYTTTTMQTKLANALYEETNTCNMTDGYLSAGSESDIARNPKLLLAGSVGTAQNEIQLLKEQLDQQSQQTHAALIQLQLVREQLLTEQNARIEAQARTHQLLVHNKELLDHIAALVAHLQEEKTSVQSNNEPHVAMPQQNQNLMDGFGAEHSETSVPESSPLLQSWGLQSQGLIENQMVTSCLPPSPLRTSFNSTGSMFNCSYPTLQDATFEGQLLQRLQALIGYTPSYSYNYQPLIQSNLYGAPNLINSVYSLQTPPQKKISPINVMKSCTASPVLERRVSPGSNSDYIKQPEYPVQSSSHVNQNFQNLSAQQKYRTSTSPSSIQSIHTPSKLNSQTQEIHFIKPLSQLGTLTTTDVQGRVRVIVPIPSQSPNGDDDAGNLLSPLRVGDELRPQITRSTSEKVPNRSELMSQVQRTAWARHTTK